MFQKSDYCSVAPNRCFRKLCEFEGQTVPVFSAVVSDLADLPKPDMWQSMDFDGQTVLFDKYSIALTLGSGCVVKKWVPQGMDETQTEICGIELHFVESSEDDFVPMSASLCNSATVRCVTHAACRHGTHRCNCGKTPPACNKGARRNYCLAQPQMNVQPWWIVVECALIVAMCFIKIDACRRHTQRELENSVEV